ncbi:MAG: Maltodextrin ABC transporter, permease protein MdxF, partial [uncultured Corynebacteriales bacterium]
GASRGPGRRWWPAPLRPHRLRHGVARRPDRQDPGARRGGRDRGVGGVPADRPGTLAAAGDPGGGDRPAVRRLPLAAAHPAEVPAARHAVPDRLPDRAGDLHDHHRVHELRRRAPGEQAGRGHRRPGGLRPAGPGLRAVPADGRRRRRPGHRRAGLPAHRPGDRPVLPGHPGRAGGPVRRRGDPRRQRPGHRRRGLHRAHRRAGRGAQRRRLRPQRPDRLRGDQGAGAVPGVRGQPAAGVRRRLRLRAGRHHRPDLDRRRLRRLLRRRRGQQPRPGLEGQRRPAELRRRADRPGDPRVVPVDPAVELRLRVRGGRADLRAGPAGRDGAELPGPARPADLPLADHPAVRDAGGGDAAGLAGHVQHRLRPDQPAVRAGRQLVRRRLDRPVRGAAGAAVAGLQLHVPGLHRRAAGDPEGADRGGLGGRRHPGVRVPGDHLPAAAGRAGPAADLVLRLQLQQLQRDLPGQRRQPVPAGQPAGRRDGHPHHLHLPAGLRRRRGRVRLRRRRVDLHLPDRGGRVDPRLPPHPRAGGDQL